LTKKLEGELANEKQRGYKWNQGRHGNEEHRRNLSDVEERVELRNDKVRKGHNSIPMNPFKERGTTKVIQSLCLVAIRTAKRARPWVVACSSHR